MKRALSVFLFSVLMLTWVFTPAMTCRPVTPQKATLNSIGTLQVSVHATYDGLVDLVVANQVEPKALKDASRILNEFNSATIVAVRNAPLGTNGVAPPNLLRLASDLTLHVNQFHPPKP